MIIDLSSPFWCSLIVGIILLIIAGTYHYIVTLISLNFTNKKLGNVLSELDVLGKNYEKEVSNVNKGNNEEIANNLAKAISIIIEHNKQPPHMTLREALDSYGKSKSK
jgi:hypothetical protein